VDLQKEKIEMGDIIKVPFPMKTHISSLNEVASEMNKDYYEMLIDAFKIFDKDGSGEIDVSELAAAMKEADEEQSAEDLELALKEADVDKSGRHTVIYLLGASRSLLFQQERSTSWSSSTTWQTRPQTRKVQQTTSKHYFRSTTRMEADSLTSRSYGQSCPS